MLIIRNGAFALNGLARAVARRHRQIAADIEAIVDGHPVDRREILPVRNWIQDGNGILGDVTDFLGTKRMRIGEVLMWDRDTDIVRTSLGWFRLRGTEVNCRTDMVCNPATVKTDPVPMPFSGSEKPAEKPYWLFLLEDPETDPDFTDEGL